MDRVETLIGVRFQESLVIRLHSEIDQIHLSIEAHCVTTLLPLGDCHTTTFTYNFFRHQNCRICTEYYIVHALLYIYASRKVVTLTHSDLHVDELF